MFLEINKPNVNDKTNESNAKDEDSDMAVYIAIPIVALVVVITTVSILIVKYKRLQMCYKSRALSGLETYKEGKIGSLCLD